MFNHSIRKAGTAIFCGLLFSSSVFARNNKIQRVNNDEPASFTVFINGGVTLPFTDVNQPEIAPVFGIGGTYTFLPYLSIALNVQKGRLKEGEEMPAPVKPFYHNDYFDVSLMARFFPVKLIHSNTTAVKYLGYIYGSTGITAMLSNVTAAKMPGTGYGYIGNYHGTDFLIPAEVGVELPVWVSERSRQAFSINVNYRHHFSFSDKLDGYVPTVKANERKDAFDQFTIGLAYSF